MNHRRTLNLHGSTAIRALLLLLAGIFAGCFTGFFAGCSSPFENPAGERGIEVRLSPAPLTLTDIEGHTTGTKGPLAALGGYINVMAYDENGLLSAHTYSQSGPVFKWNDFDRGKNCTLVAFINFKMGAIEPPLTLEEALAYRHQWPDNSGELQNMYYPMSGMSRYYKGGTNTFFVMTPMVASYRIRLDRSALKGSFTVTGLRARNCPARLGAFTETAAAGGDVSDVAYIPHSMITLLNHGDTASMIIPENIQGALLPENTDPWRKVPGDVAGMESRCTYFELSGTYRNDETLIDTLTYRIFMGRDNCSDFSVVRNTEYLLNLSLSDEAATGETGGDSWKVSRRGIHDLRQLKFAENTLAILRGGILFLEFTRVPERLPYVLEGDEALLSSGIRFEKSYFGSSVKVSCPYVPAGFAGNLIIRSLDGAVSDTCGITIKALPGEDF